MPAARHGGRGDGFAAVRGRETVDAEAERGVGGCGVRKEVGGDVVVEVVFCFVMIRIIVSVERLLVKRICGGNCVYVCMCMCMMEWRGVGGGSRFYDRTDYF